MERHSDPDVDDLAAAIAKLGTARVLDCNEAADVTGVSRSLVDSWCRAKPGVPHDARPGRRPAFLLSELDVVQYALDQPNSRKKAMQTLRARRADWDRLPGRASRGVREVPLKAAAAPGEEPSAEAASDTPGEVARLRTEVVRLQEQVAHLANLVEELEASDGRKTAMWLSALRTSNVPGTAAALDGLKN